MANLISAFLSVILGTIFLTDVESLNGQKFLEKNHEADNVRNLLDLRLGNPSCTEHYHHRVKRQLSSPLLINEYGDCLSQPSCADVNNMTSTASGSSNVIYIATQGRILKVRFGENSNSTCVCTIVYNETEPALSITSDGEYIYWLSESRTRVMYLSIASEDGVFSRKLSPEMLAEDKKLHRAACKIPSYVPEVPSPLSISATHATFNLSGIKAMQYEWFNSTICLHEANPNITFAFLYKRGSASLKDWVSHSCFPSSGCLYKRVSGSANLNRVMLGNLSPNTDYLVHVVIYSEANYHKSAVISPARHISTQCTVSSPPHNLRCQGVNNSVVRLSWDEPQKKNSDEILYKIYSTSNTTNPLTQLITKTGGGSYDDDNLEFIERNYSVRAVPINCGAVGNRYIEAFVTGCWPLQPPVDLNVERATNMQVQLLWQAPEDGGVQYVIVEWIKLEGQGATTSWTSSKPIKVFGTFRYTVTDLVPNTGYSFRTRQQYIGNTADYGWLYSKPVNGKTMPGVPGYPYNIRVVERSDTKYLTWTQPDTNGAPLEYYIVSYRNRSSPNASRILFDTWVMIRDISARSNDWEIKKLSDNVWYEFRVSAVNAVGEGDASEPSSPFLYTAAQDLQEESTMWIILGATGGLVMLIFILILVVACRRCGQVPASYLSPASSEITTIHLSYGMDLQLAQLRQMSELASFRGVSSVPQDYMDLLPLFPREKLELTDFLGKGAFGEVFRGLARGFDGDNAEKRVAVKTLRQGSTDTEKCEFLMEAYFMSNFDHKNILSLLGVCLDNEPHYLIMELMEGGDLLHYLRDARANPIMGPKLTTTDLLDICLDVAAGCKYLEDERFIHRDLAARNCLVSTKMYATENRVVKIGDFGLARDIYKNEYYHKMGEGLVPVRWMAPESLLDNLYTTQSDVWSFGVLLWEIMSFGQQPYPTYTNIEVLQHVRAGGRLQKPDCCPNDIYALLTKCWHNTPTLRPSFSWALQWLQSFKRKNLSMISEDSDYDVSAINYATVTTSDEDFIDEDESHSPLRPRSPELNTTRNGHENNAFVSHEHHLQNITPSPSSIDIVANSSSTSENMRIMSSNVDQEPTLAGNASGYLHVSEDPHLMRLLSGPHSHHREDNARVTDGAASSNNDLNYSVLNFPLSRNQSQKSNAVTRSSKEICACVHSPSEIPSTERHMNANNFLLPYMGDLPITDEERLLRKQQWNRQTRVGSSPAPASMGDEEDWSPTERPDERAEVIDTPYLRGLSFLSSGPMDPHCSHSDLTSPKLLFQDECHTNECLPMDNLNVLHESKASPHVDDHICNHHRTPPTSDIGGGAGRTTVYRNAKDRTSVNVKSPYANIATYV